MRLDTVPPESDNGCLSAPASSLQGLQGPAKGARRAGEHPLVVAEGGTLQGPACPTQSPPVCP